MSDFHFCDTLPNTLDFLGYMILCAPDEFPPDNEMTLDRAFGELRYGLELILASPKHEHPLFQDVASAEAAFADGDLITASHKLGALEEALRSLPR